jgi:hypothetical protein
MNQVLEALLLGLIMIMTQVSKFNYFGASATESVCLAR